MDEPNAAIPFRGTRQYFLVCLGLALAVGAAYLPLWNCGFVGYDDYNYVVTNDRIHHGINGASLAWAFTSADCYNWHPLTWISHIFDYSLFGNNPAGHHATSLLWHAANSILLFLLLVRLTKGFWPGALAAALFALHPLHVESVAWISERKDVLSAFFWLLTMGAYLRYVEEFKVSSLRFKVYYAGALVFFALGLMAKPMVVTLPFVLILLDHWPLGRGWRLGEKTPFFILAAASCVVTYLVQHGSGAVASLADLPMGERLKGIPISYARYLGKTFWPVDLAVLYPVPAHWPVWEGVGATLLLTSISAWIFLRRRTQPYLAVGWLWFLGVLVPVIGIIQVGAQSMADRYDYIPSIGLTIMVVWWARYWTSRIGTAAPAILGGLTVASLLVVTPFQVKYWTSSETLFRHTVEVTRDNGVMEGYLGAVLLEQGKLDEAMPHLWRGVAFNNEMPGVHGYLAKALIAKGRMKEALTQRQLDVEMDPANADAQYNFAAALLDTGLAAQAIPHFQASAQLRLETPDAIYKLGNAFMQAGRSADAISQYEKSLKLRPDWIAPANNLAWILAACLDAKNRNGPRSVELASRADKIAEGTNITVAATLAAVYAEAGHFPEAIATVQRAIRLAEATRNPPVTALLRSQLALYEKGLPVRDNLLSPR